MHIKLKRRRLAGFNPIFAVSAIDATKKYYAEFQEQHSDLASDKRLKIALIYSFGVNEEEVDGVTDENFEDTYGLDKSSRDFLENVIKDYNALLGTSYDTSSDKRSKKRESVLAELTRFFERFFDISSGVL